MTVKKDVLIIGAGAAGSTLAFMLSRLGLSVMVLERGPRQNPQKFEHNEFKMIPRLYKYGGPMATTDNDISFLQGSGIGGSTVINNAIWMRANLKRILPKWEKVGAHVDAPRLELAYNDLENWLRVSPSPPDLINHGTDMFFRGCQSLGVKYQVLSHNRVKCTGCGWCNYGCKYNRKTSALVTFVPWAEQLGAKFIDNVDGIIMGHQRDAVTKVKYRRKGKVVEVDAKQYVVSCGAIGSSEFLLANKINYNGNVGTRFNALGGVILTAQSPTKVSGFDKIGLTTAAVPNNKYILETYFAPPGALSITLNGWGKEHARRMKKYAYFGQAGVMLGTSPTGRLIWHEKSRKVRIRLKLNNKEIRNLCDGMRHLAEIYLAGGATAVYPGTISDFVIKHKRDLDKIDDLVQKTSDINFGSAHPQGGNPMSEDPKIGVVDNQFKVHGFKNLSVADASVFPENIWANCQATVMGMAHVASDFIAKDAS